MIRSTLVLSRAMLRATLLTTGVGAAAASAQTPQLPPVRPLGAVEHTSADLFGAVSTVRALPGGHLLLNDVIGRKVVLYDSTLASFKVVADTTSATASAYGARAGGLIPYKGDSTLFVDTPSLSMLVIDPAGKVGRVMSVPRPNEVNSLVGGGSGAPGFDAQGRLVYRSQPAPTFNVTGRGGGGGGGGFAPPVFPDSGAIIRVDLATRKVDTVGLVRIPKINMNMTRTATGGISMTNTINPMPLVDDWAILSDGSVAILRGQDYHIDWSRNGEALQSTPKVPFAWRHLDDSTKAAFIDSTKTAMGKVQAERNASIARGAAPGGNVTIATGDGGGPLPLPGGGGGGGVMVFRVEESGPGGRGDGGAQRGPAGGAAPGNLQLPPLAFVSPSELPDYAPPFAAGAARGDADGNLWVRTSNVMLGGSVYDVINSKGELVDRVLVPAGRVIAGFGPGGVVYMGVRDGAGVRLEQARRRVVQ